MAWKAGRDCMSLISQRPMLRSLSVWYWCAQGIGIEAFQQKAAVGGSQMRLGKVDALWRSEALQREAQKAFAIFTGGLLVPWETSVGELRLVCDLK